MFRIGAVFVLLSLMVGCSATPPKPAEPEGELFRINHFNPVTMEAIDDEAS